MSGLEIAAAVVTIIAAIVPLWRRLVGGNMVEQQIRLQYRLH